jgi:hypothetical protein
MLFTSNLLAACLVVTPAGAGAKNGADWNNAYAGLPTTLVRGDTYYLADGTYPAYVFTTADSGASIITIKKAIASDNCTSTGWNTATMGSSQAVFTGGPYGTGIAVRTDHIVVNGQVGAGEGATPYGFKIDDSNNATECGAGGAAFCRDLPIGDTGAVTDVNIQYLEIAGACTNMNLATNPQACDTFQDRPADESLVYAASGSTYLTLSHLYLHHVAGGIFEIVSASDVTIEYDFLYANNSTPTQHDNCLGTNWTSNNVTLAYNSFHDCEGTAVIAMLGPGAGDTYTNYSWAIYGNIVWYTANNGNNRRGVGDGFFGCIDSQAPSVCSNILIYNNTLANMTGTITEPRDNITPPASVTGNIGVLYINGATGSATLENNLYYNNALNINFSAPGTWTEDYNTSLNPGGSSSLTGTHDVTVSSGAADPFVDDAHGVFLLNNDTSTGLAGGLALSAPYNVDPNGITRGVNGNQDRGAFQFVGEPAASLSTSSFAFSPPSYGAGVTSAAQTVTVTNAGNINLIFTTATLSGTNSADFSISADTCVIGGVGQTIAPLGTCTVSVTFTPSIIGAETATLSLASNDPLSPATVSLSGTGSSGAVPSLSTSSLTWAGQVVGTTQSVTLTNTGNTTLTISSITISGSQFAFTGSNTCGSTLASLAACTITVAPTVNGNPATTSFTVAGNGTPATVSATLAASGIVPGAATTAGGTAGIQ